MTGKSETAIVPVERVVQHIHVVRGHKVLLDSDLARLYGVPTKHLVQAVKRNLERFPSDFMFQLVSEEQACLRSQIVTSKGGRGGRRYPPYAFTEQGVAMLSSVLNSGRAVQVNIAVMRAFVKLREIMATNRELARRFAELEKRVGSHDAQIQGILEAIRQLLAPPAPKPGREIGFHVRGEGAGDVARRGGVKNRGRKS
jgi:hypothetical protein